jgi:hypothetical protein
MPTLTKAKKTVAKKATAVKRSPTSSKFPGLVRDPMTGLLVNPIKPGQHPISRATLQRALAEAL